MQLRIILRNVFSNWVAYLTNAMVGLLLSPFIVHRLGATGYGLWTLIVALTGYFSLLDLGIRQSVGRYVARFLALKDEENASRVASTAFVSLSIAGAFAFLATIVIAAFFFDNFKIEPQHFEAARIALLIAGVNIGLTLALSIFTAVLIASERYDAVGAVSTLNPLLRAVLIVLFLKNGYGVITLAVINLAISIASYVAMGMLARRLCRPVRLSVRLASWPMLKELFSFGIFRFIWIVGNQMIFYTDSLVIGSFLNAAAIAYFTIASSLINYGRNFVEQVADTFYPLAARLDAQKNTAAIRDLLIWGTTATLLLILPIGFGYIFLGQHFIGLWMGNEFLFSATILAILTIPQFTGTSQYLSTIILAGMAKHRVLAYLTIGEGIANLALSILLVRKWGLIGVAIGIVVPHLTTGALIIPWYTLRTVGLSWKEYLTKAFVRPLLCAVPFVAICFAFSRAIQNPTWGLFVLEVFIAASVFYFASWFVCLGGSQREMIIGKLRGFVQRRAATPAPSDSQVR